MTNDFKELINKDGNEITVSLPGTLSATATNYGVFYIVNRPIEIMKIKEVHSTAGTDAGGSSLQIEKLIGTASTGGGDNLLKVAFDLNGTSNTVLSRKGYELYNNRILKEGNRLSLRLYGTPTDVAGVCVTIYYKYASNGHYV